MAELPRAEPVRYQSVATIGGQQSQDRSAWLCFVASWRWRLLAGALHLRAAMHESPYLRKMRQGRGFAHSEIEVADVASAVVNP